jgi:predicted transcriptional regulator
MSEPLTTVEQQGHVAAAAYLMKHAGTTAVTVLDAQDGQPIGIITEADITRAIADGKDVNSVRVYELMIACPGGASADRGESGGSVRENDGISQSRSRTFHPPAR